MIIFSFANIKNSNGGDKGSEGGLEGSERECEEAARERNGEKVAKMVGGGVMEAMADGG